MNPRTKTFIGVKPGLFREPKHRQAMGEAIWLYMYIVDRADWERGSLDGWKDGDVAREMSATVRQIRKWRKLLTDGEYILCVNRGPKGQAISITKWVDPRTWMQPSPANEAEKGTQNGTPLDGKGTQIQTHSSTEGDTNRALSTPKVPQIRVPLPGEDVKGTPNPNHKVGTLHSYSNISKEKKKQQQRQSVFAVWEEEAKGLLSPMLGEEIGELIDMFGEDAVKDAIREAVKVTGPGRFGVKYVRRICERWGREGRAERPAAIVIDPFLAKKPA